MRLDPASLSAGQTLETDLCVVGAGAAGITLARALANSSHDVILLEGGGELPSERSQGLYEGEMATVYRDGKWGEEDRNYLSRSRLRYFGGTTNHWNGWCRPLEAIDFEARPWVPHSGWPITRAGLDPWYRRALPLVEIPAFPEDEGYGRKRNRRMPALMDSEDIVTRLFRWSPPTRFGLKYADDVFGAPNVRVLLEANALRVRASEDRRAATRVDVQVEDGPRIAVRAKHFVIACGGVENARLLLLSELGGDAVGRYFQDHPHIRHAGQVLVCDELGIKGLTDLYFRARTEGQKTKTVGVFATSPGFQRRQQTLGFSAQLRNRRKEKLNRFGEAVRATQATMRDLGRDPTSWEPYAGKVFARGEQLPNPESRITLADERDRLGLRKARLDWQLTDADRRSIRLSMEALAHELGRASLGRMRIRMDHSDWPATRGGDHHIGTTRMSTDPAMGVVDANCRVHGMDNLHVAGSSVFSTSGFTNPTFTITALALRLAHHLGTELSR